jgi:hypothetical protein
MHVTGPFALPSTRRGSCRVLVCAVPSNADVESAATRKAAPASRTKPQRERRPCPQSNGSSFSFFCRHSHGHSRRTNPTRAPPSRLPAAGRHVQISISHPETRTPFDHRRRCRNTRGDPWLAPAPRRDRRQDPHPFPCHRGRQPSTGTLGHMGCQFFHTTLGDAGTGSASHRAGVDQHIVAKTRQDSTVLAYGRGVRAGIGSTDLVVCGLDLPQRSGRCNDP